jgi:N-acetylmuramoyl-L-alanine amidase
MVHARDLRNWRPLVPILVTAGLVTACGTTAPSAKGTESGSPSTTTGGAARAAATTPAGAQSGPGKSSTSPLSSAAAMANGLAGKTVVLDPGHDGGNAADPAAVNALVPMGDGKTKACDTTGTETSDGYQEHAFNFDVSQRVATLLRADGVRVILTRANDTGVGPCVNVRAAIGNDAHADAALSIHADGFDGNGHGFQILEAAASAGGTANDAKSQQLATALHATLLSGSGLTPSTYLGTNGYDVRNDLAGLNLSTVPKVLIECGNMRDAGDAALEESAASRQRMAQAIVDGIVEYLHAER